jgi:hypothetical protein
MAEFKIFEEKFKQGNLVRRKIWPKDVYINWNNINQSIQMSGNYSIENNEIISLLELRIESIIISIMFANDWEE